jgi:hypothetical protein
MRVSYIQLFTPVTTFTPPPSACGGAKVVTRVAFCKFIVDLEKKHMGFKGLVILLVLGIVIYSIYQVKNNSPFSQEVADRTKMERLKEKSGGYFE